MAQSPPPSSPRPAPAYRPLTFRERTALNAAPVFLRIALGAIFLWAGLGKVLVKMPVQGEQALDLYNLGVIEPPGPEPRPEPAPDRPPVPEPEPQESPAGPTEQEPGGIGLGIDSGAAAPGTIRLVRSQPATRRPLAAADFDRPVEVPLLYGVALGLVDATTSKVDAEGKTSAPILPAWMGRPPWAVVLSYMLVIAEIVGGAFVVLGLFTRFWALALAFAMLMAMWMTSIGPAVVNGPAMLGFLPDRPYMDPSWTHLFLQFALFCSAMALLVGGPGTVSLDRAIFRPRRDEDDD